MRPNLNTLEALGIIVILLDNRPPAQDSAQEIVSFFCFNFLIIFLTKVFILST